MMNSAEDMANRAGEKINEASERAEGKLQELSDRAKQNVKNMVSDEDAQKAREEVERNRASHKIQIQHDEEISFAGDPELKKDNKNLDFKRGDGDDLPSVEESSRKVGNSPEHVKDAASRRMKGTSYGSSDTVSQNRTQSERQNMPFVDAKDASYNRKPQDREVDHQNIQPGTRNLVGTEDNFDNDPGISIGTMEDKIRETKEKITGGADHMLDNVKKTVKQAGQNIHESSKGVMGQTGQNIQETTKGIITDVKDTVMGAGRKVKEALTGEREDEKPDETKSEVRTTEGTFPPGTKPIIKGDGVTVKGTEKDNPTVQ